MQTCYLTKMKFKVLPFGHKAPIIFKESIH